MPLGRQGPIAKALTSGIGLTQEYKADRQARKEREASPQPGLASDAGPKSGSDDTESDDDEAWAEELDTAEDEWTPASQDNPNETVDDIARTFLNANPLSTNVNTESLPKPVILPQRRPGMRTRGWIRGYAPSLAERGISQIAWLDFLAGFEKAIGKNRWFHVLNLAVWVADKIRLALQGVSLIARVVSAVIHLSLEMSRRGYIHAKQNKYLDQLNDEYFKPRGLYALVVKYKPKKKSSRSISPSPSADAVPEPIETVDINTNTSEAVEKRMADESKFWKGLLKGAASKTTSDEEIPDFAPLTFPYLDSLDEAQKESAIKRNGAFLADYYDRRAQATFAVDNQGSKLADVAPRKQFASEYADPTSAKSQGGLLSTLSGGKVQPPSERLRKRMKGRRGRLGIGGEQTVLEQRQEKRAGRKSMRPMKRLLRQDALYLMVVDLPSQEEQDAVRRAIEALAD